MKIGTHAPIWKVPCLMNGKLEYLSLTAFQGNQLILCCVPSLAETAAWLLDRYVDRFRERKVTLAVLTPNDDVVRQTWIRAPHEFHFPFLTDPLRRLGRTLRLSRSLPVHRCETLFFDQDNRLHFRLFHDLNLKGITTVLEVAESDFCQRSEQVPFESRLFLDHLHVQHSGLETPSGSYTLK
jgi:hypothetical protein